MLRTTFFVSLCFLGLSCSLASEPSPGQAGEVRFSPAAYAAGDFYAIPWPSALRISDGRIDLTSLPARESNFILSTYLPVLEDRLHGFSPNGATLFFFDVTLDTTTLPAAAADSLQPGASAFLVNVEPDSAHYGERIPIEASFNPFGGTFQPKNTLTLLPLAGFPMAPGERYAAIVRNSVLSAGQKLRQPPMLSRLLRDPAALTEAGFAPLAGALSDLGLTPDEVVAATVFRTSDPTAAVRLAREALLAQTTAPEAGDWAAYSTGNPCPLTFETATYHLVEGEFQAPTFLRGPHPYEKLGSGVFAYDDQGRPQIQGWETIRFSLSLPAVTAPAEGFPAVIYQHGAGGNRNSFVRDGTACSLAQRGIAVIAIDFPLHGDRKGPAGHDPVFILFNPENVPAALDIENQASIDLFSLTRLAQGLTVPAGTAYSGAPAIRLRPAPLGYIGHSQGAFVGAGFLAFEDNVDAGILSGSGGHFITFITDRIAGQSIDLQLIFGVEGDAVQDGIAVLLGIPGERPDRFHFLFTLIQTIADPIDPVNYAPFIIRESSHPKHIYQSAGFLDAYDPPAVNQALATALGVDLAEPVAMPYPNLSLRGGTHIALPAAGNRQAGGKAVTAVNSQFPAGDHWVYLSDGIARTQGSAFLASALRGETPVVPARCAWQGAVLQCPEEEP